MRICVPTENENGLEAAVCAHFGSTPFFSVLDIESEAVESIQNANQHHEHGSCHPLQQLAGTRFEAIAVRGIGRNAIARLGAAGIPVFVTTGTTLREVLAEAKAGLLQELHPGQACPGHGHNHHQHH